MNIYYSDKHKRFAVKLTDLELIEMLRDHARLHGINVEQDFVTVLSILDTVGEVSDVHRLGFEITLQDRGQ